MRVRRGRRGGAGGARSRGLRCRCARPTCASSCSTSPGSARSSRGCAPTTLPSAATSLPSATASRSSSPPASPPRRRATGRRCASTARCGRSRLTVEGTGSSSLAGSRSSPRRASWPREPGRTSLLGSLGGSVPLTLRRGQIGRYCPPASFGARARSSRITCTSSGCGRTGRRATTSSAGAEAGRRSSCASPSCWARGADPERLADFARELHWRLPATAGGIWRGSWASFYDFTPDGNPVVDRVPGHDGLIVATGGSGHAFKLAPALGLGVPSWSATATSRASTGRSSASGASGEGLGDPARRGRRHALLARPAVASSYWRSSRAVR